MIKIIENKQEWCALLDSMGMVDFYHTYDYHMLDKKDSERPIMINFTEGAVVIAFPLLVRKIQGTAYNDATSVYGYPGPVTKNVDENYENTKFCNELNEVLTELKIISVFTRLNPFIPNQEVCLNNIGEIVTLGNLVNIDLSLDLETQRRQYQKRLKTYINKAKRHCIVKRATTEDDLESFIAIYHENMSRIQAKPEYFFNKAYFQELLQSESFKAEILLALDSETGKAIAGTLYIKKGEIVQYHLSGARKESMYLNPVKLLIDTIRIEATQENYRYLNLGGGVGSKEDSLFRFKNSFSQDLKSFRVWKCVCNEKIYAKLVHELQQRPCAQFHENCNFYFPCYRCAV